MVSRETTEAHYTFQTGPTLTARYHDGRTRRAVQVEVTSPAGNRYSVLVPMDGQGGTCTCPQWENRCKGTTQTCKHQSYAIGHLLREAEAAPAVSPSIVDQIEEKTMDEPQTLTCACCGAALTPDTWITTIKHSDGTRGGWVCRDSKACLDRRNAAAEARLRRAERDRELLWPAD